jgi:probable rRNA maturation factor
MNRSYAGTDSSTDVLSFADGEADPDSGRVYFGDVVICVPMAAAQARRADHPLVDELSLLTIHGVLHLLGHDHSQRVERQRMWAAQAEILSQLGLSGVAGAA